MTMPNFPDVAMQIADQQDGEQMFVAVVTALIGDLVTVRRIGAFAEMTMPLVALTSYVNRTVGDQVLVAQISGAYWVLGTPGAPAPQAGVG